MIAPTMKTSRVSTGIIVFDEMLYGGVPKNNQILLYGDAGTGKSLLTFEMLYRNAKLNIPTTYVTLEETKQALLENVKNAFSYFDDIDDLMENQSLLVDEQEVLDTFKSKENWEAFIVGINKRVQSNKSQILVIDSLTPLRPLAEDDRTFTRYINSMIENFRNLGVTTFVTLEHHAAQGQVPGLMGTFMFDGIIRLHTMSVESSFQYLMTVVKMRRSNHRNSSMPYEITNKGFNVFR